MYRAIHHAVLAILLATGAAATPASEEAELEGVYAAVGVNPDGSEYRGFVLMVRQDETFLMTWMFPRESGEAVVFVPASAGVGIVSDRVLAVSYYTARTTGVVIYRIEEDGKRLAGRWTVVGDGGAVHTETLTRMAGAALQPVEADPPPPPKRPNPVGSGLSL
jgi:hypothetical protein